MNEKHDEVRAQEVSAVVDLGSKVPWHKNRRLKVWLNRIFIAILVILAVLQLLRLVQDRETPFLPPSIVPGFAKLSYIYFPPAGQDLRSITFRLSKEILANEAPHYKASKNFFAYSLPPNGLNDSVQLKDCQCNFVEMMYMPCFFDCHKDAYAITGSYYGRIGSKVLVYNGKQYNLKRCSYFDGTNDLDMDLSEAMSAYYKRNDSTFVLRQPLSLEKGKVQVSASLLNPPVANLGKPIWYGAYRLAKSKYRWMWLYAKTN